MKKILRTSFLALILLGIVLPIAAQQITVGVIDNGVPMLTMNDAQLTSSLSSVLRGGTLSNSTAMTGTDTLGQYYYIRATVTRQNQANPGIIAIILSQSGNNLVFVMTGGGGCTMECSAGLPCTACDQVIFEKCKRQRCKCSEGSGGCNSTITFPD